jgi:hypothetical protein
VRLPGVAGRFTDAQLLHGGKVEMKVEGTDLILTPPARDSIDTIVILKAADGGRR